MTEIVVLILAWNGERFLGPCLRALVAQQNAPPYAILVVDNGSTDASANLVTRAFPQVGLLRTGTNLGFAGGNNAGLRAILGDAAPGVSGQPEAVVLLNQDTEVAPNWLAAIAAGLERHPQAGILGCTIVDPAGQIQHTGGMLEPPTFHGRHHTAPLADDAPAEFVTGAAMVIRRSCLEQIGLLDSGFHPAYFEDVDYCYRARAAGFAVICLAAAHLMHHENSSLGAQSAAHQRIYHRNRLRFALRHGDLAAFTTAFVPAERAEIARWSITDSTARKRAYLDAMLTLPAVLAERTGTPNATQAVLIAALRELHSAVVAEERARRAESYNPPSPVEHDPEETKEDAMTVPEQTEPTVMSEAADLEPVDVAEIMRQVRARIVERQGRQSDAAVDQALGDANRLWDKVHTPLTLPAGGSPLSRAWELLRNRMHHEVRSYLDPMIFRQTEFNGSVVRTLNSMARRLRSVAPAAELEALRDEVTLLREQVRRLEESGVGSQKSGE
jgi:GT2 family glycosyltransferase